jgi:dolichyl-phosphate-mannose--protein O-mannosyl transferase
MHCSILREVLIQPLLIFILLPAFYRRVGSKTSFLRYKRIEKISHSGIALALFSCKNSEEAESKTALTKIVTVQNRAKDLNIMTTSEVVFENAEFGKVYEAYLDVKASLVNTDATTASKAVATFK